jgi:hypothetical protein
MKWLFGGSRPGETWQRNLLYCTNSRHYFSSIMVPTVPRYLGPHSVHIARRRESKYGRNHRLLVVHNKVSRVYVDTPTPT